MDKPRIIYRSGGYKFECVYVFDRRKETCEKIANSFVSAYGDDGRSRGAVWKPLLPDDWKKLVYREYLERVKE